MHPLSRAHSFSRLPSLCHRCFNPVSRRADSCPNCHARLERMSVRGMLYVVLLSCIIAAAMFAATWVIYQAVEAFGSFDDVRIERPAAAAATRLG